MDEGVGCMSEQGSNRVAGWILLVCVVVDISNPAPPSGIRTKDHWQGLGVYRYDPDFRIHVLLFTRGWHGTS